MKEQGDLLCNHLKKAFTEGCEAVKNVYKSPANKIRKSYLKKSRIVAMSFCEPRSCVMKLSS